MNVLIPALARRSELTVRGLESPELLLPLDAVEPAERAEPGAIALLHYERWIWDEFAGSAVEVAERPHAPVSLVGIELGERVLVVPDPAIEEEVAAFWRVGHDDALDVAIVDPADLERISDEPGALRLVAQDAEPLLLRAAATIACGNSASRLTCAERDCRRGQCVPFSWIDEKYPLPQYACVCAT